MAKLPQSPVTIYRGWLEPGKFVWSPYVIKLETRLRLAGVPYKTECGSTKSSPRGKIPYIDCREIKPPSSQEPALLSDSTLIVKQLIDWGHLEDLNANLSPESKAHDMSLRALLEDKLNFYHAWERWIMNFYTMREHVLQALPYFMRVLIGMIIYRSTTKTLYGQGTGRFTAGEIADFRLEVWESVNALLSASKENSRESTEPFWVLGGKTPTEADTTVFGFITSVLLATAGPDSQRVVKEFPVILEYQKRIHETYFPDYERPV